MNLNLNWHNKLRLFVLVRLDLNAKKKQKTTAHTAASKFCIWPDVKTWARLQKVVSSFTNIRRTCILTIFHRGKQRRRPCDAEVSLRRRDSVFMVSTYCECYAAIGIHTHTHTLGVLRLRSSDAQRIIKVISWVLQVYHYFHKVKTNQTILMHCICI